MSKWITKKTGLGIIVIAYLIVVAEALVKGSADWEYMQTMTLFGIFCILYDGG
ncbi:MAG: hypothetical protein KAS32_13270 [Candidatus Peribacteraceae bacterium]|nr:hypothetical protein [Candidatus Peribacteraceae bacterium]